MERKRVPLLPRAQAAVRRNMPVYPLQLGDHGSCNVNVAVKGLVRRNMGCWQTVMGWTIRGCWG